MGNHHEKVGLQRILCACQFTIPTGAAITSDPAGESSDMWSSKGSQASRTPSLPYSLLSSTACPSSTTICFLSTTLP